MPTLIAIAGSAGSLAALEVILQWLPPDLAMSLAIVVHLAARRQLDMAHIVSHFTSITVKEADDKEAFVSGRIYVAPADYHLLIEKDRRFALSIDPPVAWARPSLDVFLDSAARALGPRLVAVLLSGASDDGARGLAEAKARGGLVIVQDPDSAEVARMPRAGLAATRPDAVLDPDGIGHFLAHRLPRVLPPVTQERKASHVQDQSPAGR